MKGGQAVAAALLIAVGLAACGWFVGRGFMNRNASDRYVTVKGLSERDVSADIALWPLRFVATNDDLGKARDMAAQSKASIMAFLERHGIAADQVELSGLEVTDVLANPYRSGPTGSRFIINQTLMVRSEDVERIREASQDVGALVDAGVVLTAPGGMGTGPTYLFTRLNDLKPEMIAEATRKAREAGEQFARDSGSSLGAIRRANQGVFVILPRDRVPGIQEQSQWQKTVRVVSTVEYSLDE